MPKETKLDIWKKYQKEEQRFFLLPEGTRLKLVSGKEATVIKVFYPELKARLPNGDTIWVERDDVAGFYLGEHYETLPKLKPSQMSYRDFDRELKERDISNPFSKRDYELLLKKWTPKEIRKAIQTHIVDRWLYEMRRER